MHKIRKKTFVFLSYGRCMYNYWRNRTDTELCEQLRSIGPNCQLLTKLEELHILQAHVCSCIIAHLCLPHQKTKRETSDALFGCRLPWMTGAVAPFASPKCTPLGAPYGKIRVVIIGCWCNQNHCLYVKPMQITRKFLCKSCLWTTFLSE